MTSTRRGRFSGGARGGTGGGAGAGGGVTANGAGCTWDASVAPGDAAGAALAGRLLCDGVDGRGWGARLTWRRAAEDDEGDGCSDEGVDEDGRCRKAAGLRKVDGAE